MRKFKIGDKVICVGNSTGINDSDINYGGAGWKKGFIFIISRITSSSIRPKTEYICWPEFGNGVWSSHLDLYIKNIKEYGIVKFLRGIK